MTTNQYIRIRPILIRYFDTSCSIVERSENILDHIHLLIKPASSLCNLKCKYCFYNDISSKRENVSYGFMSETTLENITMKTISKANKSCTFSYQGGEPTLIGLDFFKKSIKLQKKFNNDKNLKIYNSIQTNGYNLNEEWAKFFYENKFLVGISIDGTNETHDKYRITKEDKGSFSKVMQTIHLFNKYKVEYNVLTVINSLTARRISKIYNFYKKQNFKYLQFIPCLDELDEQHAKNEYSLKPKAYGEFLKNLFDLWYRDYKNNDIIHIRQFENYIEMMLGLPPESCGMSGVCSIQNVVESDGSVYPCDFYVLDKYNLGNLNYNTFDDINIKRNELNFLTESTKIDYKCTSCKFYFLCRGGCKRYREPFVDKLPALNYYCESYYDFFEYANTRIQSIANHMK